MTTVTPAMPAFFCAGINQTILLDRHRPRQKVARQIGHPWHGPGLRNVAELHPLDRFVRRDVDVSGRGAEFQFALIGQAAVVVGFAVPGHACFAGPTGLFDGFLTPTAGEHVIGTFAPQQVHRQHRKLQARPALQEQNAVAGRNAQQFAQALLRFGPDRVESLRAMADFEDRHADAGQRDQVPLGLFDDRQRQDGRPG